MLSRWSPEIDAAVLLVQHMRPSSSSALVSVLDRSTALPVTWAEDRLAIRGGHVYVAPPDRHLVAHGEEMRVLVGPSENGHRPAIDVLFESAAAWWGPAVIGIVVTGALDDGSAGLRSIHARGGHALVQDPEEAFMANMPRHALDLTPQAEVRSATSIAARVQELTTTKPLASLRASPSVSSDDPSNRRGAFASRTKPTG
jgi:two-component system chemotaxis response regulator CheB